MDYNLPLTQKSKLIVVTIGIVVDGVTHSKETKTSKEDIDKVLGLG